MKSRLRPGSVASKVIEALRQHGCATRSGLMFLTGSDADNLLVTLHHMEARKLIVVIGTIDEARAAEVAFVAGGGLRHMRGNTRIFALKGTPQLPPLESVRREALGVRRSSSGGIKATSRTIPAYRWFVS